MLAHEKLIVYQRSIDFVAWVGPLLDSITAKLAAKDQLDRASTSIPLNIAEGNGKFSMKDRARFLQMAHGSSLESAACLDVLVARKAKTQPEIEEGKRLLEEIVSMLFALLNRFESRLAEDPVGYGDEEEGDEDEEGEGEGEMIVADTTDLLYPLTLFCQNGGHALPSYEAIEAPAMPQPYRDLLVHHGDMTSRLATFFGGDIVLEVLHHEHTPEAYRREVVLHIEATGLPVEYGAIEIDLGAFHGELRELILEHHLPLGGLLNRFGVQYRSEPKAFIKLGADAVMQRVFGVPDACEFYGRSNVLLDDGGRTLARIVEVLRPVESAHP